MKTINTILSPKLCTYPLSLIGKEEDLLFVDIETTGFTARTSDLYLIGCIYFKDNQIHLTQWFAQTPEEEKQVLESFVKKCKEHKYLIHYNGNNFDIPYMRQKCLFYHIQEPFSAMEGVDLYKRIMPYKKALMLENLKQKTVERFLGIERTDIYNGGELISIYKNYVKTKDSDAEANLLLHNEDDMKGMLSLLPILTYADIFFHPMKVVKVQTAKFENPDGSTSTDLMMKIKFPFSFPKSVTYTEKNCRFQCHENEGYLKVPIVYGEMKYFYSNYKDYYYLPEEDMAMHKSVASFVDKSHRIQATSATCYTKKEGAFLPQWDIIFSPVFKANYKDTVWYFELTDDMKHSPDQFASYALHVIDMLAHSKDDPFSN